MFHSDALTMYRGEIGGLRGERCDCIPSVPSASAEWFVVRPSSLAVLALDVDEWVINLARSTTAVGILRTSNLPS